MTEKVRRFVLDTYDCIRKLDDGHGDCDIMFKRAKYIKDYTVGKNRHHSTHRDSILFSNSTLIARFNLLEYNSINMLYSALLTGLGALITSTAANPMPQSPTRNNKLLSTRQGDGYPEALGKFSYCNGCVPDGGGASCTQTIYAHWGYGSYGNCDDTASEFTSLGYCTDPGTTVDTPAGAATWVIADGCDTSAPDHTHLGDLQAPDNIIYQCYTWSEQWDDDCLGVDYACTISMYCY